MGFDLNGIQLMAYTVNKGLRLGKTVTIGRQNLYINDSMLKKNSKRFESSKYLNSENVERGFRFCELF